MRSPLFDIALNLTADLAAEDRFRRLAVAVRRLVRCDSAALFRLEGGVLVPVAAEGLVPEVLGLRFHPDEHPRLAAALAADRPVRFTGSELADPFDGLLASDTLGRVHACLGCALRAQGDVVGLLMVDAVDAHAFDDLDDERFATFAALAGATLRTASLIEALEEAARRQGSVARDLLRAAQEQGGSEILGASPVMRELRDEIALLADSELTVLILGETGVGKELVARTLHARSRRHDQALIYVNCAALPETIAESELFGHTRGAFTGANEARPGKFEVADHGTLFLDEIGELTPAIQAKLLRALQTGELQRVGADRPVRVDVRVVAATNRDLSEEVRAGRFRADLYHRLSVYPIVVPPLRHRGEDVHLLAGWFLERARLRLGLGPVLLDPAARAALDDYDWPGNVRELEHLMLRAALRASEGRRREHVTVRVEHLGLPAGSAAAAEVDAPVADEAEVALRDAVDAYTRRLVRAAVGRADGNWAEAARRLGMDRGNLHRLAGRLGLKG